RAVWSLDFNACNSHRLHVAASAVEKRVGNLKREFLHEARAPIARDGRRQRLPFTGHDRLEEAPPRRSIERSKTCSWSRRVLANVKKRAAHRCKQRRPCRAMSLKAGIVLCDDVLLSLPGSTETINLHGHEDPGRMRLCL